jgi:NTP pyrophosphatase (non-canonical NTP hydrolase)
MDKYEQLDSVIKNFVAQREWSQFHSPKNLSMALCGEAAEIIEIFQWLTEEQSYNLDESKKEQLKQEIGDVMIYLVNLASKFGFDPIEAGLYKMKLNAGKYPVEKAKGSIKKYNEL